LPKLTPDRRNPDSAILQIDPYESKVPRDTRHVPIRKGDEIRCEAPAPNLRVPMSSLIHCIYCSAATRPMSAADLAELLARARQDNARARLTGMLLYTEGAFFQVLEGPAEAVDALYSKIERDTRHAKMTKIIEEPIQRRVFGDWTMGFSAMSREEMETIPGANDFFGQGKSLVDLDAGRVRKLLEAFRSGRWRQMLSGSARSGPVEA
jgi:hypothetical protein